MQHAKGLETLRAELAERERQLATLRQNHGDLGRALLYLDAENKQLQARVALLDEKLIAE